MAIIVKHNKVSTVPDDADTSLVRPSDWNADHTLTGFGTAAELNAGVANGVATLDGSGTVPLSQLPSAVLGALNYQGTWNASTNTPTLTSSVGTKGYYYVVNVAGTTNLNGITDWLVGDWAVYNGTAWQKVDNTDAVTSVNGYTGTVVLTQPDIAGTANAPTNTNITSMTGVTSGISTPDFVQFDTTATPTIALGKERWNVDTGTLAFGIIDGTQEVQIGQQMYALVVNAESTTITKGQVVYLFGATGNKASVKLANNTGDATSAKTLGLAAQDIAAGATGFVITQGVLDKLNTGSFIEGDTLYLGATAGSYTATKPKAPNHLVYVGIVERANNGNGQIYVRVQNGYELDEIHDVQINSPANGQTILYDASTSLWKNANLTAGTGVSVTNGAASVTIANTGVTGLTAGTGISVSASTGSVTVTNTSPDQTVALTAGTGISISGTYPNFTIANTGVTSVSGTTGRIISSGGATPAIDLASGIVTAGTTGSSTLIPVITVDTYGRVTGITTASNPQGTVTSITAGTGLSGGTITSSGTIAIDSTVATLTGIQTLTNKTISGASNTLSNIGNSSLTNSAITINGSNVSLGGSVTVTATATNSLTIGSGLTGTSYNGSTAVTIAVDSTVVRTSGSYSDPTWITSLDGSKITGTLDGGSF